MKTQRRVQRQKNPNVRRIQDLRRSNASQPIPAGTQYQRKPKHGIQWENEEDETNNPYTWE